MCVPGEVQAGGGSEKCVFARPPLLNTRSTSSSNSPRRAVCVRAVLSFGTEERTGASGVFVPANPLAYAMLKFRSDEIKDLQMINVEAVRTGICVCGRVFV